MAGPGPAPSTAAEPAATHPAPHLDGHQHLQQGALPRLPAGAGPGAQQAQAHLAVVVPAAQQACQDVSTLPHAFLWAGGSNRASLVLQVTLSCFHWPGQ